MEDNTAQQKTAPLDVVAMGNGICGPINKHNHIPVCDHPQFKHCKICDVVECSNCGKEWKVFQGQIITSTFPQSPRGNIQLL